MNNAHDDLNKINESDFSNDSLDSLLFPKYGPHQNTQQIELEQNQKALEDIVETSTAAQSTVIPQNASVQQNKTNNIIIIGAGVSGLATALLMSKQGYVVDIVEKNEYVGGTIEQEKVGDFIFPHGPRWYMMHEVYEYFFKTLDLDIKKYIHPQRVTPSYRVVYKDSGVQFDLRSDPFIDANLYKALDENVVVGVEQFGQKTKEVWKKFKEDLIQGDVVRNAVEAIQTAGNSSLPSSVITKKLTSSAKGLLGNIFKGGFHKEVSSTVKHDYVQKALEHFLPFVGMHPSRTPETYTILNGMEYDQGVMHISGGFAGLVNTLRELCLQNGVTIHTRTNAQHILTEEDRVNPTTPSTSRVAGVRVEKNNTTQDIKAGIVISCADMQYTDTVLLDEKFRSESTTAWQQRVYAPAMLTVFCGMKDAVVDVNVHTVVFPRHWQQAIEQLYNSTNFPDDPILYVGVPSQLEKDIAPKGKDVVRVDVPIPAMLEYDQPALDLYAEKIIRAVEASAIPEFQSRIETKKVYCTNDIREKTNAHMGSINGLAHIDTNIGTFAPQTKSTHLEGMFYVGEYMIPGYAPATNLLHALIVSEIIGANKA